jgi:site-specific recombinase XerC
MIRAVQHLYPDATGMPMATMIYRRTRNLRAVQLLLGHSKLESTVRYLGIEVDNALDLSEQTEI